MKTQKLLSYIRKAVQEYHLIRENDIIAVGLSGGKDSLVLLYGLRKLQEFYPVPFSLIAVSVDIGFGMDYSPMEEFCKELQVPFFLEKTQIREIVFDARKESHPCSLCAKMRRGALVDVAQKNGATKLALGHHRDDYLTTLLLSLLYEGRFYTFSPRYSYEDQQIEIIRPLLNVPEAACRSFALDNHFPVIKNLCPEDHETHREEMAKLITQLQAQYPDIKERLFHAFTTSDIPEWVSARKEPEKP